MGNLLRSVFGFVAGAIIGALVANAIGQDANFYIWGPVGILCGLIAYFADKIAAVSRRNKDFASEDTYSIADPWDMPYDEAVIYILNECCLRKQ